MTPAIHALPAVVLAATVADNGFPVPIGLFLVSGQHHEANGQVGLEFGNAVEAKKRLSQYGEFDGKFISFNAAREISCRSVHPPDMAVRKSRGIKLRRFLCFAFVKSKASDEVCHLSACSIPGHRSHADPTRWDGTRHCAHAPARNCNFWGSIAKSVVLGPANPEWIP